ncbi:MAG: hypothetical protein IPG95_11275 [Saprospiraceae bacterium]|nr:hypothetical protein [Saprospiraceae bacterium]
MNANKDDLFILIGPDRNDIIRLVETQLKDVVSVNFVKYKLKGINNPPGWKRSGEWNPETTDPGDYDFPFGRVGVIDELAMSTWFPILKTNSREEAAAFFGLHILAHFAGIDHDIDCGCPTADESGWTACGLGFTNSMEGSENFNICGPWSKGTFTGFKSIKELILGKNYVPYTDEDWKVFDTSDERQKLCDFLR